MTLYSGTASWRKEFAIIANEEYFNGLTSPTEIRDLDNFSFFLYIWKYKGAADQTLQCTIHQSQSGLKPGSAQQLSLLFTA
ncbi:hypothetical protein EC957_010895 [Mortierella hygrophila]|uniref:Uncharacterized protein n=1 Tax=Mortierella hygrophila TaxID=979708 RepID=A0A9P6K487_9FUNG|nr:hypothetical protein EC957_010895 [Mortierella hygrophila]